MTGVTIRRAAIDDADALGGCLNAAYERHAAQIPDLPSMSEDCAAEIAANLVWVAEAGGTIVGGLVLAPRDGFMLLANVAVHPDMRGGGSENGCWRLPSRRRSGAATANCASIPMRT